MAKSSGIGSKLYISSGSGSAVNITAIAKGFPCIVTSAAHGLTNGSVVTLASIGGMTELNGVTAVVQYKTANTFALAGIDSTAYTTYTSGGTATPVTFQAVGGIKSIDLPTAKVSALDTTDLDSTAKEFIGGLVDNGDMACEMHYLPADTGQIALKAAFDAYATKSFKVTTSASTFTFTGLVTDYNLPKIAPDSVLELSMTVKASGSITVS